jgi:RNA polymerase sigma factor (sigma-70 family)
VGAYCCLVNPGEAPIEAGFDRSFRTTHWSVVLAAGDESSDQKLEALTQLCRTYWLPVYAFVRKRGHSPDQAKDLTQGFFERFLEKNHVVKASRERGRFRSFLMTSAENFLRNVHERSQAEKRGGGTVPLSLDALDPEGCYLAELADETDPAKDFELRWALAVLQRVIQRLRDEYLEDGRADLFDVLQSHLWGDEDSVPYPQIAERFGLTLANVKITAHRLRQRYRELLREEIAHTVAQPGEIDEEISYLMRIVSR